MRRNSNLYRRTALHSRKKLQFIRQDPVDALNLIAPGAQISHNPLRPLCVLVLYADKHLSDRVTATALGEG